MTERALRAFHVPADDRAKTGIYEETLTNLKRRANLRYISIVQMKTMESHGCVMVVDDDGHDRRLPWNSRAQFLSTYPLGHAIVGDALFLSLTPDFMEGDSLASIRQKSLDDYLQNKEVQEGYSQWLFSMPVLQYAIRYGATFDSRSQGLLSSD